MDDVLEAKLLALFTMLVLITFCTAIPIKVSDMFHRLGSKGENILSTLMCFSGGVFLAAFLLHLAPEGKEVLTSSWLEKDGIEFPMAELIMGAGFFLVLFVEQIVHRCLHNHHHDDNDTSKTVTISNSNGQQHSTNSGDGSNESNNRTEPIKTIDISIDMSPSSNEVNNNTAEVNHQSMAGHSHIQHHSQLAARSVILLVALSMDCIFEGIACGLETSVGDVWKMVLTIMSHEIVIAFGLGLELVKYNSTARTLFLSVAYGLTCPLGVAIGICITEAGSEDSNAVDVVTAVLLCCAGGVFLYVTFFQILQGEVTVHMKTHKIIALVLGFILIAVLVKVVPHSHDHDHDHGSEDPHDHGLQQSGHIVDDTIDKLVYTTVNSIISTH